MSRCQRSVNAGAGRLLLTWVVALLASCKGAPAESRDEVAAREYVGQLASHANAKVEVESCHQFDSSRRGYCLLRAPLSELRELTGRNGLQSVPHEAAFGPNCLALPEWGKEAGTPGAELFEPAGTLERFRPGSTSLPVSSHNVHFIQLYVAPTGRACLEYHFPYG